MKDPAYFLREKTSLPLTSSYEKVLVSATALLLPVISFFIFHNNAINEVYVLVTAMALLARYKPLHFLHAGTAGSAVLVPPAADYWMSQGRSLAQDERLEKVQTITKRLLDITVSGIGLLLTMPLMAVLALVVKASSRGTILFQQERIGQDGRPFMMYKFRSMFIGAEQNGPSLAAENDPRITRYGRPIRKWRLDELPQLWNVLRGDMTLVGPRPERQFFIDRITDHAPNYRRLLQLKPGLTSMGIIRFGYASTVPEMIDRQRHDQYYFENRSLGLDIAILFSTLYVIVSRKGK
jgi:lipopolysaccharide/colanic/teichoic acid biosynthesis glycosyltransferase